MMRFTAPPTESRGEMFVGYRTRGEIALRRAIGATIVVAVFVIGWQFGDAITSAGEHVAAAMVRR